VRQTVVRWANRNNRRIKTFLLQHRPPLISWFYFRLLSLMDEWLGRGSLTPLERVGNMLWKQDYFRYCASAPRFMVETDAPVAVSSADHLHPRGTVHDNSVNRGFNLRVYDLFRPKVPILFMDLGCAGGGLVRSFLQDGHLALGLEGSDISARLRSGEWETIPFHLFTCDITRPFQVRLDGQVAEFDVITSWEVLEHIPEEALPVLIDSIYRHLRPGGYFIGSVDLLPDGNPLTGANYHLTLKPAGWWQDQFRSRGLVEAKGHPFTTEDMVRGNGLSLKDWSPEDGDGIHLVLQKAAAPAPGARS